MAWYCINFCNSKYKYNVHFLSQVCCSTCKYLYTLDNTGLNKCLKYKNLPKYWLYIVDFQNMHASWVLICEQHTVINLSCACNLNWLGANCHFKPCNETIYSILILTYWKFSFLLSKRLNLFSLVAQAARAYYTCVLT